MMPTEQNASVSAKHRQHRSVHIKLKRPPKERLVVAGVVRNAEQTITKEIRRLSRGLGKKFDLDWAIVESDSSDKTVDKLTRIRARGNDFYFESLGNLQIEIPDRVDRISYCRNRYLEIIETKKNLAATDWILVVDLDNINRRVDGKMIYDLTKRGEASAYFANQIGPYYDIYALRHPIWNPKDFLPLLLELDSMGVSKDLAQAIAVESKMLRINKAEPLIFVDSAFGGMALYSYGALITHRYATQSADGNKFCEHVGLNLSLRSKGHKLAIHPGLVNARYTEHTSQFHPVYRLVKSLLTSMREPIIALVGQESAEYLYQTLKKHFH
jgi:hypothetical protein